MVLFQYEKGWSMLIRGATQADLPGMARVNVDTRRACYAGFYPSALLTQLSYAQVETAWRKRLWESSKSPAACAFVAEETSQQRIVGVVIGGLAQRVDLPYHGEIYVLYVLPDCHRQGIGRRLVDAVARKLAEQNIESLLIWVLVDNPACSFYAALGGQVVGERLLDLGSAKLKEVAFGWSRLEALILTK
jgi:ribosomal protein S18 acetylase RimI-like enzyme